MKKGLSFVILFVLLINSVYALTGSIGNARMILYPEVGIGGVEIEKSILVKNVNDIAVGIKLDTSEEFKDIVEIIDKEFELDAGQEKKARFVINLKKPGDYEGKINVFFTPLEGESKTGVALSSTIVIIADGEGGDFDGEEDEEESVDEEEIDDVTGEVINKDGKNSGNISTLLLGLSTITLLALFLVLMFIKSKKKVNKKRSDRSS